MRVFHYVLIYFIISFAFMFILNVSFDLLKMVIIYIKHNEWVNKVDYFEALYFSIKFSLVVLITLVLHFLLVRIPAERRRAKSHLGNERCEIGK